MAAKKCPNCNCECPVASNSCKKCLHVFKSRKGSSTSSGSPKQKDQTDDLTSSNEDSIQGQKEPTQQEQQQQLEQQQEQQQSSGRRHTGRITRSKPNFYDSLHVEEQMKQQKLLLRKQSKPRSDEDVSGGNGDDGISNTKEKDSTNSKSTGESEPKKRRGRPPGITGNRKGGIQIHNKSPNHVGKYGPGLSNMEPTDENDKDANNMNIEDQDIMSDISAEKTLQYNIVLDEINRKWKGLSWTPPL